VENGIHFIAGLPRSGSTLLAAVLRQNPRFHARMTSPVAIWFATMLGAMSARQDTEIFVSDAQRAGVLRGLFDSYYAGIHQNKVVFDSNRTWCAKLPALSELFPAAKIICCVRNPAWIVDSMERLVRRNKFQLSKIFNFDVNGTVYSRAGALMAADGVVGIAWNALREAFYGEHADKMLIVTFESLTRAPKDTISAIYEFLGEKPFTHDFENVRYDEPEFDARIGTPGLHKVEGRIEFKERETILPPELFSRFDYAPFWSIPAQNPRNVKAV
jgi:sulfotransferase